MEALDRLLYFGALVGLVGKLIVKAIVKPKTLKKTFPIVIVDENIVL